MAWEARYLMLVFCVRWGLGLILVSAGVVCWHFIMISQCRPLALGVGVYQVAVRFGQQDSPVALQFE